MREYSKVSPQFWIGETGRQIKAQGPEAVIIAMYLLTSPHSNMLGLYYCPISFMSHETGLSKQGALKGLKGAIEAQFCTYHHPSEVVFVHEMAKYQIGDYLKPEDKQVIGIWKKYRALPKCPMLKAFYERYKKSFHLKNERVYEGPSEPPRSQEQEQEQDSNKKNTASGDAGRTSYTTKRGKKMRGSCLDHFERFWEKFNYKKGKAEAADVWLILWEAEEKKGKLADWVVAVMYGAQMEAAQRDFLIQKGSTPKWAQGWMSGRRWEDYGEQVKPKDTFDYSALKDGVEVIIDGENPGKIDSGCFRDSDGGMVPEYTTRKLYRDGRLKIVES